MHRVREADSIKITNYPNTVNFRAWQSAVRLEVVSASGLGEVAFDWIGEVELPDTTFGSLANSGPKFVSLDNKLATALIKAAHGELGRQITLEVELAAKEKKK